jgi:hypothetical protein
MDLSDAQVQQRAEADRREVDPPIEVETARWSKAGQLDRWVKERREWWGRVRGADGHQRWISAVDLRPANGSHHDLAHMMADNASRYRACRTTRRWAQLVVKQIKSDRCARVRAASSLHGSSR